MAGVLQASPVLVQGALLRQVVLSRHSQTPRLYFPPPPVPSCSETVQKCATSVALPSTPSASSHTLMTLTPTTSSAAAASQVRYSHTSASRSSIAAAWHPRRRRSLGRGGTLGQGSGELEGGGGLRDVDNAAGALLRPSRGGLGRALLFQQPHAQHRVQRLSQPRARVSFRQLLQHALLQLACAPPALQALLEAAGRESLQHSLFSKISLHSSGTQDPQANMNLLLPHMSC